jgi:hypothetical protein
MMMMIRNESFHLKHIPTKVNPNSIGPRRTIITYLLSSMSKMSFLFLFLLLLMRLELSVVVSSKDFQHRTLETTTATTTTNTTIKITNPRCVRSEKALRQAILRAPKQKQQPTYIDICSNYITIDASRPHRVTGFSGIHIMNQFLSFRCIVGRSNNNNNSIVMKDSNDEYCLIDARYKSRHFVIYNSNVSFQYMTFINGNVQKENDIIINHHYFGNVTLGGSIMIRNTSIVTMNHCHWMNNAVRNLVSSHYGGISGHGGAIHSDQNSTVQLMNVYMNNNHADFVGGAMTSLFGHVTLINVTMMNNDAIIGAGALYSDGILHMINVTCTNNTGNSIVRPSHTIMCAQ